MRQIVLNATEARNNFFDILMAAKYKGQVVLVTKNNKSMAKIVPVEVDEFDWKKYIMDWKKNRMKIRQSNWSDLDGVRKNFKLRYK